MNTYRGDKACRVLLHNHGWDRGHHNQGTAVCLRLCCYWMSGNRGTFMLWPVCIILLPSDCMVSYLVVVGDYLCNKSLPLLLQEVTEWFLISCFHSRAVWLERFFNVISDVCSSTSTCTWSTLAKQRRRQCCVEGWCINPQHHCCVYIFIYILNTHTHLSVVLTWRHTTGHFPPACRPRRLCWPLTSDMI